MGKVVKQALIPELEGELGQEPLFELDSVVPDEQEGADAEDGQELAEGGKAFEACLGCDLDFPHEAARVLELKLHSDQ